MTARNTRGVTICCTKSGASPTVVTPTAIAAEAATNHASITVASTTGFKVGDLIKVGTGATGFSEIDGKTWTIASVKAGSFTLAGTDLSATTGTLAATPAISHYADGDMVCLCLSDLKFAAEKNAVVSVATFCDPSASIPSASTTAGTVDIGGFVDVTTADYKEIVAAEADGLERIFRVMLPNNGQIIFPAIVSSLGWDIPIDGASAWNAQLALGSRPRHLY